MEIREIRIIGGVDKSGNRETVQDLTIKKGEIFGIVGPTGSGKTQLIADIEQLAKEDTITRRSIMINNRYPSAEFRCNPRKKMVAQLSQNMNFFADMTVSEFLKLHAKCRGKNNIDIQYVISVANQLTGEAIQASDNLTILSGGQTRSLMVADVAIISESPIVLIDELENAGIKKHEALQLLSGHGKIILVVTHDPVLALGAEKRIVMIKGGMRKVIASTAKEKQVSKQLSVIDQCILNLREDVRSGKLIEHINLDALNLEYSLM
jgi:ABC-type lipoprotein export system ATPase subunit